MTDAMQWRDVPGFPDYQVSEAGQIRRTTRKKGSPVGLLMRPRRHSNGGYLRYTLSRDGLKFHVYAHRCVAEAFLGEGPPGSDVAHGDGNPTNNHASNLRYATRAENVLDTIRHGTISDGSDHPPAKLTEEQAAEIRHRYTTAKRRGLVAAMAKEYGVSTAAISNIGRSVSWKRL